MALIIFIVLFGGIAFTTWMGWWTTETRKEPDRFSQGEAAGQYNPADIRGSYTFGDVSRLFQIPIADLQSAFHLGDDPASVALKDLETLYGNLDVEVGTASVRLFSAYYKGLPYEPTEETYLFAEGVEILKSKASLSAAQLAYLQSHTVNLNAAPEAATPAPVDATAVPAAEATPTTAITEHAQPDRTITGKTTFQDLLNWGVAQADIENVLGKPMPDSTTLIKDYVTSQGLEFSSIKTALQALIK